MRRRGGNHRAAASVSDMTGLRPVPATRRPAARFLTRNPLPECAMSDMRTTHADLPTDNKTGKLIAGAVVLLGIIGLGVYGFENGMFNPESPVAYNQLPNPGMPVAK